MKVTIYNGGGQADYLYGLVSGLHSSPIKKIDILDIDRSENLFNNFAKVKFQSVYKYQKKGSSILKKGFNILRYYTLQMIHLILNKPRVIHFQWLDRFYIPDRIILPLIARLFGHKTVLTVHNVNAGKRDNKDSFYNRFTLKVLYHTCHHLVVHTPASRIELMTDFKIDSRKISVIKHGMNNKVTVLGLTKSQARQLLEIPMDRKVILFFGNIDYYKGLDVLLESIHFLEEELKKDLTLIIAGNIKSTEYSNVVLEMIENSPIKKEIISHIRYIRDEEIEPFFQAADTIAMPYRDIYQSGVLFMAYNFGLPPIATRVGNFENDIQEAKTGILAQGEGVIAFSHAITQFFNSEMFKNIELTRQYIKTWSAKQYSWDSIGAQTYDLYKQLVER